MIETRLLSLWNSLVGSAVLIAIFVLALYIIVSAVKPKDAPRHLGKVVGVPILLFMLPAIILDLWNTMSLSQHVGIVALCLAIAFLFGASRRKSGNERRR
ncbi:MAG TPA: hypothetical protein VNE63_11785 [Candidatus Acidoferrales bacterium]|nr:hypothetical protein [Candidatus Acidoferrales bacterium]